MRKGIRWFIKRELLVKTPFIRRLAVRFLEKAKSNLVTMSILFDLHGNERVKTELNIPEDYDSSEWVIVCGYYAMYMGALAALAKIGYRSKNHTATVLALETFFVKKKLLDPGYLEMLEKARLQKEQVEQLKLARERREIAQYSVTKETTRRIAEKTRDDAYKFVEKMDELIETIKAYAEFLNGLNSND